MRKIILISFLTVVSLFSSSFKVGDNIGAFSLPNQFDKKRGVDPSIQIIIVSFEKDTGANVNNFLDSKNVDFLQKHHAVFIADISEMPSIITKLFALPKMRAYKHSILLIYNENDERFIKKEGKLTLYRLQHGVIKSISFITKNDLKEIFK